MFIIEAEVQKKADDDMKFGYFSALLFCTALLLSGCGARESQEPTESPSPQIAAFTRESKIEDVKHDPVFGSYGRLLFPVEDAYYSGDTLEDLQLPPLPVHRQS